MMYEIVKESCYVVLEVDDEGNGEMMRAYLDIGDAEQYIEDQRETSEDDI